MDILRILRGKFTFLIRISWLKIVFYFMKNSINSYILSVFNQLFSFKNLHCLKVLVMKLNKMSKPH